MTIVLVLILAAVLIGLVGLVVVWNSGSGGRIAVCVFGLAGVLLLLMSFLFLSTTRQHTQRTLTIHDSELRQNATLRETTFSTQQKDSYTAEIVPDSVPARLDVPLRPDLPAEAIAVTNSEAAVDSSSERLHVVATAPAAATEFREHHPAPVVVWNLALAPIVLMLFIGGVVLVVVLLSSSRGGWLLALAGCCVVFLIVVSLWSYRRASVSEAVAFAAYNSQDASPYPFGTHELPAIQSRLDDFGNSQDIWTAVANDTHVSGTYASLEKLGRGVASRIIDRLIQSKKSLEVITVQQRNSENAGADLTLAIVGCTERLQAEFPEIKVNSVFGSNVHKTGTGIAAVSLAVIKRVRRSAPWDVSEMAVEYEIRAELHFDDSQYPFGVNYVEKPWVDNVSKYLVNRPRQMLLRARSSRLHQHESEARREAYRTAASNIAPQLATYIRSTYPDLRSISGRQCQSSVENAIANQNVFVIDRFPQSVEVHGHDLWRESVLLNVDPAGLAYIARTQAGSIRDTRTRRVSDTVGMSCLMVLVIGMCVGLNSMTKGYYKNPLVIVAGVSVLGVFLLLLT
jgi:energy-coupling factor transporter transmembrane protein EcfT